VKYLPPLITWLVGDPKVATGGFSILKEREEERRYYLLHTNRRRTIAKPTTAPLLWQKMVDYVLYLSEIKRTAAMKGGGVGGQCIKKKARKKQRRHEAHHLQYNKPSKKSDLNTKKMILIKHSLKKIDPAA